MRWISVVAVALLMSGCAVVAVADLAVTAGATVVKAGVKTVGAAVDMVLPDKQKEEEKPKSK